MVYRQSNEDNPVYGVKLDNAWSKKTRTLRRNLLLPFMSTLDWHTNEEDLPDVEERHVDAVQTTDEFDLDSTVTDAEILSAAGMSSDDSDSDSQAPITVRDRIPMRRPSASSRLAEGEVGIL